MSSMPSRERVPPRAELRRDFGLDAVAFVACPFGFGSECWIVDHRWFVKVFQTGNGPANLRLLGQLADRGLPIPRPLREELTRTDDGRRYAVFPYIPGRHATGEDGAQVARSLRCVHDVECDGLDAPMWQLSSEPLVELRSRLDHPWIVERRRELSAWLDRFEAVLDRARSTVVPVVLSHDDFGGQNVILDDNGNVVAIVDWDTARLGPREHDLWLVIDEDHPTEFLNAYGVADVDLDITHVEYGLLHRCLGDLAARVIGRLDRPGITTWGFDRLARVDDALALFA